MAQIVRLGGNSPTAVKSRAEVSFDPRRGLLIAALAMVIAVALGVVVYVSLPRTPANIVAGPATPDVSNDSAVFDPQVAEVQQRVRQAEQEKEDSAVFGQAPSAPAYQASIR
jgi:predicted metalloprotease